MQKLTVRDAPIREKRVLVRVDFNCPLQGTAVQDDTRIRESIPTIQYLFNMNARVILLAHAGRPKGRDTALSLKPMGAKLSELVGKPVKVLDDCVGASVREAVAKMKPGEIVLLENLRFHAGEEKNDPDFAGQLAALGEVYVNDGFGVSHRAHASVHEVAKRFPKSYAGFLLEKEVRELGRLLEKPDKPFVAILGGAKVSDKITVIENLLPKLSTLLIGGAMAYTFMKSAGLEVGNSLVETEKLDVAREIRTKAQAQGVHLVLPRDHKVVKNIRDSVDMRVQSSVIPREWLGIDIGPMTLQDFKGELSKAKTIFWNGPVGAFEIEAFSKGTVELAKFIAQLRAVKIIGGGDTALAVDKAGVKAQMNHVSTGGGAALEFLEGKELPGIAVLTDAPGGL